MHVSIGVGRLVLEELGEDGHLLGDGIGEFNGCECIGEFSDAVSTGKLSEDDGDAGGIMHVVVGERAADCLESWPEFAAPIFGCGDVDVREEYKRELCLVDGNAIG